MLVEDNRDDADLTMRAFRKRNLANSVRIVRDGAAALDVLLGPESEQRPLPRLVMLDLHLPKVDGIEVLRQLRAAPRTRHLPVVVLTSSSEENDVVESYAMGANSFVQKPVDFDAFVAAVGELGFYWLLVNRPIDGIGEDE